MLDIGWSEMLLIAAVAIIVIGPKDLPKALRTLGQWVGKARSIAREFQSSVDQMIADAEVDEIKKTANAIGDFKPDTYLQNQVDPTGPPKQDSSGTSADAAGDTAPSEPVEANPTSQSAGAAATVAAVSGADEPDIVDDDYHPPSEASDGDDEQKAEVAATAGARSGET